MCLACSPSPVPWPWACCAAGPSRRFPRCSGSPELLLLPFPQPFLALEDAALDGPQRFQLLAQGFLALVALLVGPRVLLFRTVALARHAVVLADQALALRHLRQQQGCKPPQA